MEPGPVANRTVRVNLLLALLLLLSALALLWRSVLTGEALVPAKLLPYHQPWAAASAETIPWNPLMWDGVAQFYVWRDFVWRTERAGTVPLWNPHQLSGTPLLANSQSAPIYPIHLLLSPFPTRIGMLAAALLHLWIAGFGMALLLRYLGLGVLPSAVGGVTFQLNTFMIAWLALPSVPSVASWYPWIALGCILAVRQPGALAAAVLAVVIGMMLLAGHLQIAFYGMMLATAFSVYELVRAGKREGFRRVIAGAICVIAAGIVGFALAFPQLLPSVELGANSHRIASATEAGYRAYTATAMPAVHLVAYALPDFFGHPMDGTYWGATNYAENAVYVGIPALVLGGLALARRRAPLRTFLFLALIFLALAMALGTPLNRLFYFGVPGFSATGSPARALILAAFGWTGLAAFGAQRLADQPGRSTVWSIGICFAALLVLIGTGWLFARSFALAHGIAEELVIQTASTGVAALVVSLTATALLATCAVRFAQYRVLCVAGLALVSFAGLWSQNVWYNPTAPEADVYPECRVISRLKEFSNGHPIAAINVRWNLYEPPMAALPPNAATVYGLYDIGGYDSLMLRSAKERLDWLNGQDSAPVENGNMLFVKRAAPELAELGVQYVYSPVQEPGPGWETLGDGIYQLGHTAHEAAVVQHITPTRMRVVKGAKVQASESVRLFRTWTPGWRVYADSHRASRVSIGVHPDERGFMTIEAGRLSSALELRYEPASFHVGLYVGVVAIFTLSAALSAQAAIKIRQSYRR